MPEENKGEIQERKIIAMSGHSDSGKTTIASWLIQKLSEYGNRVVFIKNIPHDDLNLDMKGKDTDRAFMAGASKVIGRTPTRSFSLERKSPSLTQIISQEEEGSVLIVEGFHSEMEQVRNILRLHVLSPEKSGNELNTTVESTIGTKPARRNDWPEEKELILETVLEYIRR